MADKANGYKVVSRVMRGRNVVGYKISKGNDSRTIGTDQMSFLVGKGLIEDVKGVLYNDNILISGTNGFELKSLPVERLDDPKADNTTGQKAAETKDTKQYILTKVYKQGRKIVAYEDENDNRISKEQVQEDALDNKITNATAQHYNGKIILRGRGISLKDLPFEDESANNTDTSDIHTVADVVSETLAKEDDDYEARIEAISKRVMPGHEENKEKIEIFEDFKRMCEKKDFSKYNILGSVSVNYGSREIYDESNAICKDIREIVEDLNTRLHWIGFGIEHTIYYSVDTASSDKVGVDVGCDMLITGSSNDMRLYDKINLGICISLIVRYRRKSELARGGRYAWCPTVIGPDNMYNIESNKQKDTGLSNYFMDRQLNDIHNNFSNFVGETFDETRIPDEKLKFVKQNDKKFITSTIVLALHNFLNNATFFNEYNFESTEKWLKADGFTVTDFQGDLLGIGYGEDFDMDYEGMMCRYSTTDEEQKVLDRITEICHEAFASNFYHIKDTGYIYFSKDMYVYRFMGTHTGRSNNKYGLNMAVKIYRDDARSIKIDLGVAQGFYRYTNLSSVMTKLAENINKIHEMKYRELFGGCITERQADEYPFVCKEHYGLDSLENMSEHDMENSDIKFTIEEYASALRDIMMDIDQIVTCFYIGMPSVARDLYNKLMYGQEASKEESANNNN